MRTAHYLKTAVRIIQSDFIKIMKVCNGLILIDFLYPNAIVMFQHSEDIKWKESRSQQLIKGVKKLVIYRDKTY